MDRERVQRLDLDIIQYIQDWIACPYCNGTIGKYWCIYDRQDMEWMVGYYCMDEMCGKEMGPLRISFYTNYIDRYKRFLKEVWGR